MAKKELSEIELMEAKRLALEEAKKKKEMRNMAKPSLLTRYFVGFLDFLITGIITILIITFLMPWYLSVTNYSTYQKQAADYCYQTNLYDDIDGSMYEKDYDATIYDTILTNYYTTNEYAISNNMLEGYINSKKDSGLYELKEGNYVLVSNYDEALLKDFLTNEYNYAISFIKTNPIYIEASNRTLTIFALGIGFVLVVTTSLFYLIIPLLMDEGETLGQKIFKICLIDTENLKKVTKKEVAIRFFFNVFFHYYIPAVIMLIGGSYVMLLPVLISIFVIGFDKNNRGIHDLLSNTMVICKHRTNAVKMLNDLKEQNNSSQMSRY